MFFLCTFALVVFFCPTDAWAFGPAAHLDVSLQLLFGAVGLPAVHKLISRYPVDFAYGALAADSILGKNRAAAKVHCHSWGVAHALIDEAQVAGGATEAFMRGYLSHLGADVIAHNCFVPTYLFASPAYRLNGHLFFEARYDQRILETQPEVAVLWAELRKLKFPAHDAFLAQRLVPTIFSNRISSTLYRHSVRLQFRRPWRNAVAGFDKVGRVFCTAQELAQWREATLSLAVLAVNQPRNPQLIRFDPTGFKALQLAKTKVPTQIGEKTDAA